MTTIANHFTPAASFIELTVLNYLHYIPKIYQIIALYLTKAQTRRIYVNISQTLIQFSYLF